jgi:hypothetical protein
MAEDTTTQTTTNTPPVDFEGGVAAARERIKQSTDRFNEVSGAIIDARAEADKANIASKFKGPMGALLGPYKDKLSNFSSATMKRIEEINGYMDVQSMLLKVVPPIRLMMSNAFGDKIIGPGKILKEAQAMAKQLQMDLNNLETMVDDVRALPAQMNAMANSAINDVYASAGLTGGSVKDFSNLANGLQSEFTLSSIQDMIKNTPAAVSGEPGSGSGWTNRELFQNVVAGLKQNGITPIIDGPSIILVDNNGNKVIDFSNGMGPIGINLTALSESKKAEQTVHALVKTRISDFQFIALVSFVSHIGSRNFAGSGVLRELNKGNYKRIPTMMLKWQTGAMMTGGQAVQRPDYTARRLFEAELFTTADWVNFDYKPSEGSTVTWSQLTTELQAAKQRAFDEIQGNNEVNPEQYTDPPFDTSGGKSKDGLPKTF